MSAVVIQNSGKVTLNNITGANTISATNTFTAGSSVIVSIASFTVTNAQSVTSVVVDGVTATRQALNNATDPNSAEIWLAQGLPGLTKTIVITVGAGWFLSLGFIEVTGLSNPAGDLTSVNGSSSGPTTTPNAVSGTLGQSSELVVALFIPVSGILDTTTAPGAPWVTIFTEPDGNNNEPGGSSYNIVASTASVTATWTLATSQPWKSTLASFKVSAAVATNGVFFGSGTTG